MRPTLLRLMLATVLAVGVSATAVGVEAAAQTTRSTAKKVPARKAAPKPAAPEPPPPPPDPANQVKTSDQVKRESVQGAVSAPLRDLNVVRTDIPEILLKSLADPYARPPAKWSCRTLINLILPLEEALGPDIDKLPGDDPTLSERGKSTALGLGADLASGAIPFRGVVRRVTGAAAHDQLVQNALLAGSVRRAYLKGLGESKGCGPPATPSHERAGVTVAIEQRSGLKPQYPTRQPTAEPQTSAGSAPSSPSKPRS